MPQRLVPEVPDGRNPAGAKPLPVPAKTPSAPKMGDGKGWSGKGIPADVCDDGAGGGTGICGGGLLGIVSPGP
jgi:hypothetical protein